MRVRAFGVLIFHAAHRNPFVRPLFWSTATLRWLKAYSALVVAGSAVGEHLIEQLILPEAVHAELILGNGGSSALVPLPNNIVFVIEIIDPGNKIDLPY